MMNFHISLNASNIDRSVAFYSKVFGPPAKHRHDYAKFEVAEPPLVLSLEPTPPEGRGSLNHVGLRFENAASLVEKQRQLELAGLRSQREEGVECCYAKQTKFWLHDPDGVLWEFYTFDGDIEQRGAGQVPDKVVDNCRNSPVSVAAQQPAQWEHVLGQPIDLPLSFADGSVSTVHLRGSFNTVEGDARRGDVLSEARRVLAPHGRLSLHMLTADRDLEGTPDLPGPAAFVKAVPTDVALLASLEQAGFVDVRLTKFGASPCFRACGAEMRETKIEATVPAPPEGKPVTVIYRGPFRELTDDDGRIYCRGERVVIRESQWERLVAFAGADAFTRLATPELATLACSAK